jgi:hypothetical protein
MKLDLVLRKYYRVPMAPANGFILSPDITPRTQSRVFCASSTAFTLNQYPPIPADLVSCFSEKEWEQRCSLAVSYRIAYLHSWHENIFNHITAKVDGSDDTEDGPHFLLNDFALGFDEITAANLVQLVKSQSRWDGSPSRYTTDRRNINPGAGRVFKPGYVLHSAIHAARSDVRAV